MGPETSVQIEARPKRPGRLPALSPRQQDRLREYVAKRADSVEAVIDRLLPAPDPNDLSVHSCMRYATAKGKRLRAILLLATVETLGGPFETALPTACAMELIHSHSLILDDLPCMDGHEQRRGRSTSHRLFGESTALLAADALLNLAIATLARNHRNFGLDPTAALDIIEEVGEAVRTVIDAQADDLAASGQVLGQASVERIERGKTGALFRLSVRAGARLAAADDKALVALTAYADCLGLAFQIADDLLDVVSDRSDSHRDGKTAVNYALACGEDQARLRLTDLTAQALEALGSFDCRAEPLRLMARYNATRKV
jgi:geranylgeranyl diphosphate synthase, type II